MRQLKYKVKIVYRNSAIGRAAIKTLATLIFLVSILSISTPGYSQTSNGKLTTSKINKSKNQKMEIEFEASRVTLVNVIKVDPKDYTKVLSLLKEGTDSLFSKQKGFIGLAIHSNEEQNTIVLYGQWEKRLDIENFRKDKAIQIYFKSLLEMAKFESIICDRITYIF